jgi:hypothetical protein
MARSTFAGLLENDEDERTVITLPAAASSTAARRSARASELRRSGNLGKTSPSLIKRVGKAVSRAAESSPRFSNFPMELAGLEPATSWVRSRRSPN